LVIILKSQGVIIMDWEKYFKLIVDWKKLPAYQNEKRREGADVKFANFTVLAF
jgi:uncharacterized membrane protein (Fun14 family)